MEPSLAEVLLTKLVTSTVARAYYKGIPEWMGLRGDEFVLDYGSGSGAASEFIAQRLAKGGGHLTCVDVSTAWMQVVRSRLKGYSNVDYHVGDIEGLPLKEGVYDAILIHLVVHHVEVRQRLAKVRCLQRKLKAGGRLYVREPTAERHGMKGEELRSLMKEAGLEEVQFVAIRPYGLIPMVQGVFRKD